MHASVTSCFNAGVALVGASVIAVSPIAMPDDPPHISDQAVQLVADPISFYTQVFQTATANGGQLLQEAVSNSVAAASQALNLVGADAAWIVSSLWNTAASFAAAVTTVPGYIPAILVDLASGNLQAAVNDLNGAVSAALQPVSAFASLASVVVQPVLNTLAALSQLNPLLVAYSLAGPVINVFGATGAAIQSVVDAVAAGDAQAFVNAVLTAPGVVIDGVLNGGYGPPIVIPAQPVILPSQTILSSGLLSVGGLIQPLLSQAPGPIAMMLTIGKTITDNLLKPPSATSTLAPENATVASTAETVRVSLPHDTTETIAPQSKPTDTSDSVTQTLAASVADTARRTPDHSSVTDVVDGDGRNTEPSEPVGERTLSRPSIRAVPTADSPAVDKGAQAGLKEHDGTAGSDTTAAHADDAPAANHAEGSPS